ncbi:MAG: MotE family protein [Candidatus Symbiobacter sp.]|nr:MotE family protein [Candidatus Symbiobacter sp.]
MPILRILPFTIFVAFLALSVKIKDMFATYPVSGVQFFSSQAIAGEQNGMGNNNMTKPLPAGGAGGEGNKSPGLTAVLAANNEGKNNGGADAGKNTPGAGNNLASLPRDPSHFSQSEIDLLQALAERRDNLEAREKSLQQREMTLAAVEKRLGDKAAALEGTKAELLQLVNRRNEADQESLRRLVKIYEAMKPRDAAQILEKLDTDVAIGVISLMKENKVAPIMGFMNPNRAQILTVLLADRHTSNAMSNAAMPNAVGSMPGGNTNGGFSLGNNNAMSFGANAKTSQNGAGSGFPSLPNNMTNGGGNNDAAAINAAGAAVK